MACLWYQNQTKSSVLLFLQYESHDSGLIEGYVEEAFR